MGQEWTSEAREEGGKVLRFPPLPHPPAPPLVGPDFRQVHAERILGAFSEEHPGGRVPGANLRTGYHAAQVNLGALKAALDEGLRPFSMAQLRERWEVDVREWVLGVIRAWVQRCRRVRVELLENEIRVELQTQDDHGSYDYGFDVFPGRESGRPAGD